MRTRRGWIAGIVVAGATLFSATSAAWSQEVLNPPTGGNYLPVPPPPDPSKQIGEGTVPVSRPAQPPVIWGDSGDRRTVNQKFRKTPDPGEILYEATGRNWGTVIHDEAVGEAPQAPSMFQSFAGAGPNGWTPADPDIGVGAGYVCQVVNDDYIVYDKCGNIVFTRDANDLFGFDTSFQFFDPKIVYDPWNGRWVMLWLVQRNPQSLSQYSRAFVAVSRDSNPIGVGSAGWYYYPFDMVQDGGTADASFADYYDLGYGNNHVYIGGDQFRFSGSFRWSRMVIWLKSEIYNEVTAFRRDHFNFNNPDGTPMRLPRAVKQQSAFSNQALFINSRRTGGNRLTKWVINDPFGANTRTGTDIAVADYTVPPNAIQPNGTTIDTIDCRLMTAVQANDNRTGTGTIISTALASSFTWSGDTAARSIMRCYRINASSNAVILDQGFGASGLYYWFPSVGGDYMNTALWVFARCGPGTGQFPESRYVGYEAGTWVNSSSTLQAGSGNTSGFRWGDYFGGSLDWDDYNRNPQQCRIWLNGMHGVPGNWATQIASTSTFSKGVLNVSPSTTFISEGPQGGPFSPTSQVYTLSNTGQTGLSFTVTNNATWLSNSIASGELFNTANRQVTGSLNAAANSLAPGVYNGTFTFSDCSIGGATINRNAQLTVRPRNNTCSAAITIPSGTTAGSNAFASTDITGCTGGADVWYRWVAPCTGMAQAETCGSNYDTTLGIYATCSAAGLIVCNDDYFGDPTCLPVNRASRVTWNIVAGRAYFIRVAGFSSATGNFNLFVSVASDYNRDGQVDFFDYLDFVNDYAANRPRADFNGDGQIDFFDYLDFVNAYAAGC